MKVVTFGEIMMKLSPLNYQRFEQASLFSVEYAGAEANVAVSLANFGVESFFVSKVPNNEFGDSSLNALRHFGVNIQTVVRGGDRLGLYFVEKGASQRPSKVVYDRRDSAIAQARASDFNWDSIFEGADWFHFTGITPALSESLASICEEACQVAHSKGITISCDLNYRKKLWSRNRAKDVMSNLCKYVDVCIANEEDAADVFGIYADNSDANNGLIDTQSYISVARMLQQQFGFRYVSITLRQSITASDNNWSAVLFDGHQVFYSKKYAIHLVDRIGGGDSFGAGLIYGLSHYDDLQKSLEFAVAASCLKQTIEGDFNHVKVTDVESLVEGDEKGRIKR